VNVATSEAIARPKLRGHWLWWGIGWLLVLATINESLQSKVWEVAEVLPSDKLTHFTGYFLLTLWFAGLARRSRYLVVGAFMLALGGSLEIAQGLMHQGRTADWYDMLANTLGIGASLGVAALGLGNWMVWIERLLRIQK
jgi:VanZ family protein